MTTLRLKEEEVPVGASVHVYAAGCEEPYQREGRPTVYRKVLEGLPPREGFYDVTGVEAGSRVHAFEAGTTFAPVEIHRPSTAAPLQRYAVVETGRWFLCYEVVAGHNGKFFRAGRFPFRPFDTHSPVFRTLVGIFSDYAEEELLDNLRRAKDPVVRRQLDNVTLLYMRDAVEEPAAEAIAARHRNSPGS